MPSVLAVEHEPIVQVLICIAVILAVGKIVSALCRKIEQPVVIGEIIAGVMLGPSLLGLLPGHLEEKLFPLEVRPYLKLVAQVGLILFMFVVGLEVDLDVVRRSGKRAVAISLTSIAVPLALGILVLGPVLHGPHGCVQMTTKDAAARHYTAQDVCHHAATGPMTDVEARMSGEPTRDYRVPFLPFALFLGVAMCGTAFAVLARILSERHMFRIPLGALLVACAAIDDVVAFTLLAFSAAVASGSGLPSVGLMLLELAGFAVILAVAVRPLLDRFVVESYRRTGTLSLDKLGILFIGLMISAWLTAQIGVHEIIGAFLFGVFIPRREAKEIFHEISNKVEGVSLGLLLPVFFVIAGQSVDITKLTGGDLLPLLLIVVCAFVGKFGGATVAARISGVPRRQAYAVGTMMNTRGLTELVILQVGLDAHLIDVRIYTMFVIMAVLTTAMAGPLLNLVYPMKWLHRDIAESERRESGAGGDRAVVVIDDPADVDRLAAAAIAFGGRMPPSITLVRFVEQSTPLEELTRVLSQTEEIRRSVADRGAQVSVVCRRSDDADGDVAREVERIAPDAVFLAHEAPDLVHHISGDGVDTVVVRAAFDASAPVVTDGGSSNQALACIELGARFALASGAPLTVRRAGRRTRRRLERVGVVHHHDATAAAAPVVIALEGAEGPLEVFAGERDRVDLVERLGAWQYEAAYEPTMLPGTSRSG